jgi:hypothetical protein
VKSIALIGAPGSGKSRLARAIEEEYIKGDGQCEECNTPVAIVDRYADTVRDSGQYEIGLRGGYMANMAIAVERYNKERYAYHENKAKTIITCGTVIETSVYLSQQFEQMIQAATTQEDKLQVASRIEGTVKMLAVLYMDTFKYTKSFYLPSSEAPTDESWMSFERNLQAAFNAYNAPVAPILVEEFKDEEDLVRKQLDIVMGRA